MLLQSVTFYQSCIFGLFLILLLNETQTNVLSNIRKHWTEKYFILFLQTLKFRTRTHLSSFNLRVNPLTGNACSLCVCVFLSLVFPLGKSPPTVSYPLLEPSPTCVTLTSNLYLWLPREVRCFCQKLSGFII